MNPEEVNRVWRALLGDAYARFDAEVNGEHDSRCKLFPYDQVTAVAEGKWISPASHMIAYDLNESINRQNLWSSRLGHWSAWCKVLQSYEANDRMEVRSYFVEPLAELCILQPSATRDRLGALATHAVHQANRVVVNGYLDSLKQDWDPKQKKANFILSRRAAEHQLSKLGSRWATFEKFRKALSTVDTETYRQATSNFRNRVSHGIAPRFDVGHVNFVTRRYVPAEGDKTDPARVVFRISTRVNEGFVQYDYGGTPPLGMAKVLELNIEQFLQSFEAMSAYQTLLAELLTAMKAR